eukprot:Tamp_27588.p1 GENE.Tamp_27588~~Tamp_27588.p1  ORF type:complete len:192 (-),score=10.43 Tamp_27588:40-615(-)
MCNVYMFNSIFFCWLVAHSKRTAHTASAHSKADSLRQPCFIAASFGPNRQPRYLHRRSVRMYCDVKDVQGSSYPCSKLVCACRHTWSCTQTLTHRSHSVSGATRVSNIDGMAPNDDVAAIWDKLRRGEEGETLAMVGHLPFLNRLGGHVLTGNSENMVLSLSNAGPACLELQGSSDTWQLKWLLPCSVLKP